MSAENRREVVRIEPREEQKRFVASVAYYLNLCHYGEDWRPLALYQDGEVVGFAMWGYDAEEESHWIGGLVIGAEYQGRGYGRAAMEALLDEAQRSYPDQPTGPEDHWWVPAHLGGTAPTPEEAAARDAEYARGLGGKAPKQKAPARFSARVRGAVGGVARRRRP